MHDSGGGGARQGGEAVRVAVGMGSNLGERARHLHAGLKALEPLMADLRTSRVYETAPVGGPPGQRRFLNACCVGWTRHTPGELLEAFRAAEQRAGRSREDRAGPRPLDLDLLLYGDRRIESAGLQVPHPRMAERAFVLVPLGELIPAAPVPGTGSTVEELARAVDPEGIESLGELEDLLEGEDGR